jgi:hypothetical protein
MSGPNWWLCLSPTVRFLITCVGTLYNATPGTLKGDQKVPKIGELLIPVGVLACARTVQLMNWNSVQLTTCCHILLRSAFTKFQYVLRHFCIISHYLKSFLDLHLTKCWFWGPMQPNRTLSMSSGWVDMVQVPCIRIVLSNLDTCSMNV